MPEWSVPKAIPDGIEPILAARLWVLRDDLTMRSLVKPVVWPPDTPLRARCTAPEELGGGDHDAPTSECYCGFWALPAAGKLEEIAWSALQGFRVGGVAKLWGRIVVGTKGWRAEWARPAALILPARERRAPAELVRRVAGRYGIPALEAWPKLTPLPV